MEVDNKTMVFAPEKPNTLRDHENEEKWHILVVDDDEEVHQVTRLAIARLHVLNRSLELHHVHSAKQCIEFLRSHTDIAVILLDVVMETPTAGLDAVSEIREKPDLKEVRIVLRTGQPGYAPEQRVIRDYDINDYREKTELNHNNFRTLVTSAIRSYQQIRNINQNRLGLQKIINAGTNLLEKHTLQEFSDGVIMQIAALLSLAPEGIVCTSQYSEDETKEDIYVVGAAGQYAEYIRPPLGELHNNNIQRLIKLRLEQKHHLYTDSETVLYLENEKEPAAIFLQTARKIEIADRQLLDIFAKNITASYENIKLFKSLRHIAYMDPLTELPNRNEFTRALETTPTDVESSRVAILIDLAHFSDINSGLGHEIGNALPMA